MSDKKLIHNLYYQPKGVWVGDIMPYGKDGTFYLYDMRDDRREGPITYPFGWSLATTKDFVHYTDCGDSIKKGTDNDRDQFIYSGCVFEAKGKVHAFYTGHNRIWEKQGKTSQVLLYAYSDDFKTWTKSDKLPALVPQKGYDNADWRDPWVIWSEEKNEYLLLLGSRLEGPKTRQTGRLVYFTSKNLEDWEFQGDFWVSNRFTMIEMPDVFKMGDWWYLVYTEYSEQCKTRYVMSRSIDGPWITPADDAFDGRSYYAARTAFDGERRVLFGWVASREDEDDAKSFQWAGTFVPHEVYQRDDGTLGVKVVDSLWQSFAPAKPVKDIEVSSKYGRKESEVINETANTFKLEANVTFTPETRDFSLRLRKNFETDESYEFLFSMVDQQLRFDCNPNFPWLRMLANGLDRPLHLEPNKEYNLKLVADGSVLTLYVDGTVLKARGYTYFGKGLTAAVNEGCIKMTNIRYSDRIENPPDRW
ncbi:hypothetical protein TRVA0_071S00342 [Trichomonascus vanleenenianus]|uniref:uncharacterized protein n=1 Tax=Trichomonascus vanleenenianus TaxID=2268995 RepID=UPI003EC9A5DB